MEKSGTWEVEHDFTSAYRMDLQVNRLTSILLQRDVMSNFRNNMLNHDEEKILPVEERPQVVYLI